MVLLLIMQISRKEEITTIMRKNNIIKFTAIALLSAFALTACDDDIIAKPTGYDDNSPVVTVDKTVFNNNFKDIYDSIREGELPTKVMDELLYQYSVSVFGNYNKITASKVTDADKSFGDITLKKAVAGLTIDDDDNATAGNADTDAFIKAHSAYWSKNKDGKRIGQDNKEVADDANPSKSEYARLYNKWKTIENRIAKKLYDNISGGSYSEENVFDEAKFLRSLSESIENNVVKVADATTFKGILTSKVEAERVFKDKADLLDGTGEDYILHRENYQANYAPGANEDPEQVGTYVEDRLIPDIYRQLLVEQYILDESYDTLGRTSARHISVLSIAKNSNYSKGAVNLMNTYVNNVVFDNARTDDIDLDSFKIVSNAWIGAFMSEGDGAGTGEYDLMSAAVPEYEQGNVGSKYFQGTAYGDMMEEIEKIDPNPKISENEVTYTGSNSYTTEVGKEIKTRELQLQDHTFTGWYVKSVGVSELPDSIKTQLFDINVANALNGDPCVEYTYDATNGWDTNEKDGEGNIRNDLINVVGKIKDQYFLRNTTRIKGNPVQNDILFESDGKYYIVLVEDAIRSKNLNKANYTEATADELDTLETYINEIVQIVANNDTYKNLSKKHWLEEMNLKYHDTVVYEYFKTNYPELFD